MKRKEASMNKFDFLAGVVLGALGMLGIMLIIMFGLNSEHDEKENSSPEVSETVSETCEFHNAESTTKPSQAPTPSPTPMPEPTPELKETSPQIPEVSVAPAIDVSSYNDSELIAKANEFSPDGEGEVTFYAIAKELYLRGEWDGTPYELGNHTVSIEEGHSKGYLLVDGKVICRNWNNLDLPDGVTSDDLGYSDFFVPGKGTLAVVDGRLVRYVGGNIVEFGKKTSDWGGFDNNKYMPYKYDLYYDENSDTLFLMTVTMPKDTESILARVKEENDVLTPSERKLVDGIGVYLYKMPDYNISKIQFIGQISGSFFDGSFFYRDDNDTFWEYQEQEDNFVKVERPYGKYTQLGTSSELFMYLDHDLMWSPFYGYYCCCGEFCWEGCKNCCNCKYCS